MRQEGRAAAASGGAAKGYRHQGAQGRAEGVAADGARRRMKITDRYSTAVHSSNLKSKPETTFSDADVLGAAGLAGKAERTLPDGTVIRGAPLGIALMRLLSGDNTASREIVAILADSAVGKAWRMDGMKLQRVQADDMARAVLAWYRDGTCKPCGGHGYLLMQGAPSLSEHTCPACKGTRKVPFDSAFSLELVLLARWMLAEVEREIAFAGPAAMAALAPRLDL